MRDAVWAISLVAAASISVLFGLYWRRTGDRFFALFAAAFLALAVTHALQLTVGGGEDEWYVYLVRLAGFGLIISAIVHKNRSQPVPVQDDEEEWPLPLHVAGG